MQQYRFNFPLFIGLIVGTLVCTAATYGLWKYQIGRKSDWLLTEAEKSREAGNFREAARNYSQYLTIHPRDDSVRLKRAAASADTTKMEDVTSDDLGGALRILEDTVRSSTLADKPETKVLRKRLVELYGQDNVRRYQDAMEHLKYLLESDPKDADLQALQATYLARSGNIDEAIRYSYTLIGYDPQADKFDLKKATAPHHVDVYRNLAFVLRSRQENPELAAKIMDQMIEQNPKSAEAYLARASFNLAESPEDARTDAEKAYELKPKEADVLLFMTDLAARDEQYEKAMEFIATGKKLHPTDVRFYTAAAGVRMRQQDYDKALVEIEEGIKTVKGFDKVQLMIVKLELQLPKKDLKGARQTILDMSKVPNLRTDLIDFYDAKILVSEEKWWDAAKALNKIRPKMEDFGPQRMMEVDFSLGLCYEKLGQPDRAIEAYEFVLQHDPENAPALAGRERALAMKGLDPSESKEDPWLEIYNIEMKKPKAQRDWAKLAKTIGEMAKEQKWDEPTLKMRQGQLLAMKDDFAGARTKLAEAIKLVPKNVQLKRFYVQLVRLDPKLGPEKAAEYLKKVVDEHGDQPGLRLDRADILIQLHAGKEDRTEFEAELAGLFAGIDAWTDAQKTELWAGMAERYLGLGMMNEARQYLTLAAEKLPNNLPIRRRLFDLSLDTNDDAGMKEAQEKILEVVGDTNDSDWIYTEARRRLSLVRRGQLKPEAIGEIRILVNRALDQRPNWHEAHVLNAELEVQAGNLAKALEHYDRAQELGRPYPAATAQHIKLLYFSGRFKQASDLLERLAEPTRYALLGQIYTEILFRTNRIDEAVELAGKTAESNPDSPQAHYLYSQLLARSSGIPAADSSGKRPTQVAANDPAFVQRRAKLMAQAIEQMKKSVELQPEFPEGWFALISYHRQLNDLSAAQATLRKAQLALSGDNLQMFLARSYDVLGRWFDAETMYRAVHEMAPEDLARTQQLAAFYLGESYRPPDGKIKATPLINKILRAGADKKLEPNNASLLWARRMGARMLADTGDYQSILKAGKLLASNSRDGELTIEDKLAMAEILGSRPEPLSRKQAISLLEEVREVQPLNEQAEIKLGELYFQTGEEWRKYASQMETAIGRFPNSIAARASFVRNLLNRDDPKALERAVDHVSRMAKIDPNNIATFELIVRIADKRGQQAAAKARLLKAVPDLSKVTKLTPQQSQMLTLLADLLIELKDVDNAEKIYRDVVARDPSKLPALAMFLGNHRTVEQSFEKLKEVYSPERIPAITQVALAVVRKQRDKVSDQFDDQIQQWLDTGLRENPNSINLLIAQADLYDLQKRYEDAAKIYADLLDRKDLTGFRRAVVLNNFSFIVSLAGSAAAANVDPMKLVEDAADILGPNSEILDTRAVVHIARKDYQRAIDDLELAVTDSPTASKYFHKAQAHLMADQSREAVEAWEKAEDLGLNRDAINRMEYEVYEQMKTKIDQIRGSSVTQADGLRRAG